MTLKSTDPTNTINVLEEVFGVAQEKISKRLGIRDTLVHKADIFEIRNGGDDAIYVGEFVFSCPCCYQIHGVNSDCLQGQRA